jgi:hypothetical protein
VFDDDDDPELKVLVVGLFPRNPVTYLRERGVLGTDVVAPFLWGA